MKRVRHVLQGKLCNIYIYIFIPFPSISFSFLLKTEFFHIIYLSYGLLSLYLSQFLPIFPPIWIYPFCVSLQKAIKLLRKNKIKTKSNTSEQKKTTTTNRRKRAQKKGTRNRYGCRDPLVRILGNPIKARKCNP